MEGKPGNVLLSLPLLCMFICIGVQRLLNVSAMWHVVEKSVMMCREISRCTTMLSTVMTLCSLVIPLTDSESPGQRHLTQAADLQSQQE